MLPYQEFCKKPYFPIYASYNVSQLIQNLKDYMTDHKSEEPDVGVWLENLIPSKQTHQ